MNLFKGQELDDAEKEYLENRKFRIMPLFDAQPELHSEYPFIFLVKGNAEYKFGYQLSSYANSYHSYSIMVFLREQNIVDLIEGFLGHQRRWDTSYGGRMFSTTSGQEIKLFYDDQALERVLEKAATAFSAKYA